MNMNYSGYHWMWALLTILKILLCYFEPFYPCSPLGLLFDTFPISLLFFYGIYLPLNFNSSGPFSMFIETMIFLCNCILIYFLEYLKYLVGIQFWFFTKYMYISLLCRTEIPVVNCIDTSVNSTWSITTFNRY